MIGLGLGLGLVIVIVIVIGERRGKQAIYSLRHSHVAELFEQAIFHVQHLTLAVSQPLDSSAEAS